VAYHISEAELVGLLGHLALAGGSVLGSVPTSSLPWLDWLGPENSPDSFAQALRMPRSAQSPKGAVLAASESMGRYGRSVATATATPTDSLTIVGVRACELKAIRYLDKVLLDGDFHDPAYEAKRRAMTIVSCDCLDCTDSCFCTLVGGRPFADEGFDINLTGLSDGWVVEVLSDKGHRLFATKPPRATPEQLEQRDQVRRAMTQRIEAQNVRWSLRVEDSTPTRLPEAGGEGWQKFAADCVECGACNTVCPTCYCFYLYDQHAGSEEFERVRTWDSCLLSTYHRMAGGSHVKITPRPQLLARLANRVLHKFTYSPQQHGMLSCVGCGRCIDACLGRIDIRQMVRELSP